MECQTQRSGESISSEEDHPPQHNHFRQVLDLGKVPTEVSPSKQEAVTALSIHMPPVSLKATRVPATQPLETGRARVLALPSSPHPRARGMISEITSRRKASLPSDML